MGLHRVTRLMIRLRRVYEDPEPSEGRRYLVERLWPRGISREDARLDGWLKELAPSDDLRRWYDHDPARWEEFRKRYEEELGEREGLLERVAREAREGSVTFVFATKDVDHSSARALKEFLEREYGSA